MAHEPPEYLASLNRVSIPALRVGAEHGTVPYPSEVLALVELAEADRAYDEARSGYERAEPEVTWPVLVAARDRRADALNRLDFGEDT